MLSRRALPTRTLGFILTVVTLAAGLPMAVEYHADHPDEALHLEHSHGGHGGLLDQADARLPGPHAPTLLACSTLEIPEGGRHVTGSPLHDDRLIPRGRAPPTDLPRAPPLLS